MQFENERGVVVLIVSAASCGFVLGTSAEMAELPLAVSAGIIESVFTFVKCRHIIAILAFYCYQDACDVDVHKLVSVVIFRMIGRG